MYLWIELPVDSFWNSVSKNKWFVNEYNLKQYVIDTKENIHLFLCLNKIEPCMCISLFNHMIADVILKKWKRYLQIFTLLCM